MDLFRLHFLSVIQQRRLDFPHSICSKFIFLSFYYFCQTVVNSKCPSWFVQSQVLPLFVQFVHYLQKTDFGGMLPRTTILNWIKWCFEILSYYRNHFHFLPKVNLLSDSSKNFSLVSSLISLESYQALIFLLQVARVHNWFVLSTGFVLGSYALDWYYLRSLQSNCSFCFKISSLAICVFIICLSTFCLCFYQML